MSRGRAPAALLALAVLAALALPPPGAAQQHDHGSMDSGVVIAHDLPASGRAYVGGLAHFAAVVLGDDLAPDVHQQMHARVTLNGAVLYETTPDSGHDYDGMHAFDVVFPSAGPYSVEALDGSGKPLAWFNGTVVEPVQGATTLELAVPESAAAGELVPFTFRTVDASGAIVPHSDAVVEVRQGTTLLFRTKTHTHDEPQSIQYAFPRAGAYTVRVMDYLSYPSGGGAVDFAPQAAEATVTVTAGLPAVGVPVPPPVQEMNTVVEGAGSDGTYAILGTFDPYTVVGPYTQTRLSAVVLDPATRMPVQHVDFKATLYGPTGRVLFTSDTLHEYDGIYELASVQPVPGTYYLGVEATRGGWTGEVGLYYVVAPPVQAAALDVPPQPGAGPVLVDVSGLDGGRAGEPMDIELSARTLAGQPFPHSEVDLQVLDADGVPALATKLHTHSDGRFPFRASLPEGDYALLLSPFPLEPTPTPVFYGASVGDPLSIPFTVGPGPGFGGPGLAASGADQEAPALAPLALAAALAALAAALRRR